MYGCFITYIKVMSCKVIVLVKTHDWKHNMGNYVCVVAYTCVYILVCIYTQKMSVPQCQTTVKL